MAGERESGTVEMEPGSELARALEAAGKNPVNVVSNGRHYVVTPDPDYLGDHYDPDPVRSGFRAATGIFTSEDAEQLKENIYRWHEEGTRHMDRPWGV